MRLTLAIAAITCALAACAPDRNEQTSVALAAGDPYAATSEIVVRFRGNHPLARAQDLEAAGDHVPAATLARATLSEDRTFAGLCLQRFTAGGAELVLASCAPLSPEACARFVRTWVERLRAMDAVEYAEPNYLAETS